MAEGNMTKLGEPLELFRNYDVSDSTEYGWDSSKPAPSIESIGWSAPSGYRFKEWNDEQDGSGKYSLHPDDVILPEYGIISLYAIWTELVDISVSYGGNEITTMTASGTKTLKTSGKYCTDDITIEYTKPSGGATVVDVRSGMSHTFDSPISVSPNSVSICVECSYNNGSLGSSGVCIGASGYLPDQFDLYFVNQFTGSGLILSFMVTYDNDYTAIEEITFVSALTCRTRNYGHDIEFYDTASEQSAVARLIISPFQGQYD